MITLMSDEPLPISLLRSVTMIFGLRELSPTERLLMVAILEAIADYDRNRNPSRSGPPANCPTAA